MGKGTEVAKEFSKLMNIMCNDEEIEEFVQYIIGDHRTLQQKSAGTFLKCFAIWAEHFQKNLYDDRNYATVQVATSIMDRLESAGYAYKNQDGSYRVVGLPYV